MSVLPNSTLVETTSTTDPTDAYDHQGAALYIAVILIWYSTGLAMMLFLQVRPRSIQQQFLFDRSGQLKRQRRQSSAANPFSKSRNIPADNNTKQILNELKDPERRQRLWKIYYASSERKDEPDPQYYHTLNGDGAAIDRINRKLADIHRIDTINKDDDLIAPVTIAASNDNRLTLNFESSKFFSKRFPTLRRLPPTNGSSSTRSTPIPNETVEMEPFVSAKPSLMVSNTAARKRNLFATRFTVEKVPGSTHHSETPNEDDGLE